MDDSEQAGRRDALLAIAQGVALSLIGWLLTTVWLVIAENHRKFQRSAMAWLTDIEHAWGLQPEPPRRTGGLLVRRGQVRRMRFLLWGS